MNCDVKKNLARLENFKNQMEEELYTKRFHNLEQAVKRSLKQMQTDGLARQLEMHKTSSVFASKRLLEVLSDNIEASREKFIQELLHEIDNAVFDRDKIELKVQKVKDQIVSNSRAVKEENKKLKQLNQTLSSQIAQIQQKQAHRESRYETALSIRNAEIRKAQNLFTTTKSSLNALNSDLSNLRLQVSTLSSNSQRTLRSSFNQIKIKAQRFLTENKEDQETKYEEALNTKNNQLSALKKKNAVHQNAYNSIASYINEVALSSSLSGTVTDSQSIGPVLAQILEKKADEAVKLHLKQSNTKIDGISLDRQNYVFSVTNYVNEELKKKENEIDEIIRQAKERRHKLKKELLAAQEKIKSLSGTGIKNEDDSMKEFEQSELKLQSEKQKLDLAMSQLGIGSENKT